MFEVKFRPCAKGEQTLLFHPLSRTFRQLIGTRFGGQYIETVHNCPNAMVNKIFTIVDRIFEVKRYFQLAHLCLTGLNASGILGIPPGRILREGFMADTAFGWSRWFINRDREHYEG